MVLYPLSKAKRKKTPETIKTTGFDCAIYFIVVLPCLLLGKDPQGGTSFVLRLFGTGGLARRKGQSES